MRTAIILVSESSLPIAKALQAEIADSKIYTKHDIEGCVRIGRYDDVATYYFASSSPMIFIGALGICVRTIAPYVMDKYSD